MTTSVQPKYAVIYDSINKNNYETYDSDKDDVVTAVTVVEEDESTFGDYSPLRGKSIAMKRQKARRSRRYCYCMPRSCCGICGCITIVVLSLFLFLLVTLGLAVYSTIASGVRMVTVEAPIDFPTESISAAEFDAFGDDVTAFIQSILNDDFNDDIVATKDLVISSHIVNGAIAQCDYMRGHAQVVMKENEFIFQTSLPMDMFPGGKHRFFVSTLDATTAITTSATTGSAIDSSITTTSFDLGKKLTEDYDGPLFVMQLLFDLATSTGNDSEWAIHLLSMNVLGQEFTTPDTQQVDILQALRDDPNLQNDPNIPIFFKFVNGIGSIRIEPDRMIIQARDGKTAKERSGISDYAAMDVETVVENYNDDGRGRDDDVEEEEQGDTNGRDDDVEEEEQGDTNGPHYFLRR